MNLIESYDFREEGLHPVLIRDSWQVTKLNYSDRYHIENINCLIKHEKSDKALSLLSGNAVLVTFNNSPSDFVIIQMEQGNSYNIRKNMAYAIVMCKGSQLFIVEKPNTHRDDVIECKLSEAQRAEIKRNINQELKNNGR